jgi:plasmid maintenance system antidote protein VapI
MKLVKRPYPKDWERRRLVRTELAKRDMTISDLARELKMKQGNVSNIINGTHRSLKIEARIAAYFGKERGELFPIRSPEKLLEMQRRQEDDEDGGAA